VLKLLEKVQSFGIFSGLEKVMSIVQQQGVVEEYASHVILSKKTLLH
jgi:hypothetical protein